MTIESLGYAGTLGHGQTWADLQYALGNRYYVEDPTALAATPIVGGLALGVGRFGGWGIADEMTVGENLTWDGPGTGETRYYLVVARRDWDAETTELVVLDPGWLALPATLPAAGTGSTAFNQTPGDVDDQPLFVVPWSFGKSQPSAPLDVRLIGGHESFVSGHALVLDYANWAGCVIRLGAATYRRVLNASGALVWDADLGPDAKRTLTVSDGGAVMTAAAGWVVMTAEAVRDGNDIDLYWTLRRSGATLDTDGYGNVGDQVVATIQPAFRPSRHVFFTGLYRGGPAGVFTTWTGEWYLHPSGSLYLQSLSPNAPLQSSPTNWSSWGHASFKQFS